jgi:hypothetical protein
MDIHPNCIRFRRNQKDWPLRDFIQCQAAAGELTTWTIALMSNTQMPPASRVSIGKWKVGLVERAPEGGEVASVYSTTKANIQSPTDQLIDLERMTLDDAVLAALVSKRHKVNQEEFKQVFDKEEESLLRSLLGRDLGHVAWELTLSRWNRGRLKSETLPKQVHGKVAREVRPSTHGLLLLYALRPDFEHFPVGGDPFIGMAFSFPTGHTAKEVAYKANKRLIEELRDGEYDD